jgi:hypothetical protein
MIKVFRCTTMFLLQLLEANMVMAGETAPGLQPIIWYDCLRSLLPENPTPSDFMFVYEDG